MGPLAAKRMARLSITPEMGYVDITRLFPGNSGHLRNIHNASRPLLVTRHKVLNFVPVPKAVPRGAVQRLVGDLEVQEDLAAMVSFVSERVT